MSCCCVSAADVDVEEELRPSAGKRTSSDIQDADAMDFARATDDTDGIVLKPLHQTDTPLLQTAVPRAVLGNELRDGSGPSGQQCHSGEGRESLAEFDEVSQNRMCGLACGMCRLGLAKACGSQVDPNGDGDGDAASMCGNIEGIRRSMRFASAGGKIFMTHVLTEQKLQELPKRERDQKMSRLNKLTADRALEMILDLKGYYIKAAQTLCGASQLPEEMEDAFAILLDQCPKEPFPVVKRIVEEEIGCSLDFVFREFDHDAVAAASIGQVHFAKLKDGTEVAVKVQYPDVEKYFRMDLNMVSFAMRLAGMSDKVKTVFETMQQQFKQEFDYTKEASIMREVAENVLPHYERHITIPLPLDAKHPCMRKSRATTLCTRKVLTMERLEGTPIRERSHQLMEMFAQLHGTTAKELQRQMNIKDPSKIDTRNKAVQAALKMGRVSECQSCLFSAGVMFRNLAAKVLGGCMMCCGCSPPEWTQKKIDTLNGPRLAKLLFSVHGHEIFQNGLFNSDPHAGNVLLMPDGRLGLIDYGAVMRLTVEQRTNIARLFIAIADEDDDGVPTWFWACGFRSKKQDPRLALLLAHMSFNRGPYPQDLNRLAPKIGMPLNPDLQTLDQFLRGGKLDDIEEFPGHLVMLQRCCMVLSGIGMELGAGRLSSAGMLKPEAVKWLKAHSI